MSVLVVDAGRVGGQLVSLYGDKPVHDWPGYHHIIAATSPGTWSSTPARSRSRWWATARCST